MPDQSTISDFRLLAPERSVIVMLIERQRPFQEVEHPASNYRTGLDAITGKCY